MSCSGEVTVGIDIGTTSVKAVAVDATGTVLDRVRVPHPVGIPAPDRFEHDAERAWRRGPRTALKRLQSHAPAAVALSTMVPSLAAVDRRGRPMSAGILYGDGRGRSEGVERRTDSDAGELLGFLRWLTANVPGAPGYWSAPAVANQALGGEAAIDIGTAFTSTPLYGDHGWDPAILDSCGITESRMPRVEFMGTPIGKVAGSGTVLAAGCVDGMCEQLVAGADKPGDVLVLCGTTLITWITLAAPVHVPGLWTIPDLALTGTLVGGPSNAGGLFQSWVDSVVGRPRPDDVAHPDRIPVWSPYLRGERTPLHDPNRRGQLLGLDLTHGPAAIRRAAFEASGFVVRHHIDLAGAPVRRIVATAGGTRVPGWMQALADCTGLPVHVAAEPEGAAIGAAYLARCALGLAQGFEAAGEWARTGRIVEPDPAWVAAADARYRIFRSAADATLT